MDSILTSVKKLIGITEADESFDVDIIMHINTVFTILNQLGFGDGDPFVITDKTTKWSDIFPTDQKIEAVKSYMYMKVRMMFDPPTSSIHSEALNKNISELEWRINTMIESGELQPIQSKIKELETKVNEHEDLFKELVGDTNG